MKLTVYDKATKDKANAQYEIGYALWGIAEDKFEETIDFKDRQFALDYHVNPFLNEAKEWLEKAADKNHADALELLGLIAEEGDFGVAMSIDDAEMLYLKAALAGSGNAAQSLSVIYARKNQQEKAFQWVKRAVELGLDFPYLALKDLENRYKTGLGCKKNKLKAAIVSLRLNIYRAKIRTILKFKQLWGSN